MSREFFIPARIVSGAGAVKSAAPEMAALGKKALIVTGSVTPTLDSFRSFTGELSKNGAEYSVFSGITGEPTDIMIAEGVSEYRKNGCDFLIGIGGGSALDSMKAIAAMSVLPGSITDYAGKEISGDLPPMAAIPTTAGTGSEATRFTVITDTNNDVKLLLAGRALIPDIAVIDPEYGLTAPKSVTAATALDALTHAIESYTSKKSQPLTDSVAMAAVKRIFKYLPAAYNDGGDIAAREQLAIAALEAGIAINNASVTIVHGMSRPIGALFHLPHGISNAMLLKKCLAFALPGAYERFAELARAIGAAASADSDIYAANALLTAIESLCRTCEIPTLSGYGVNRERYFAAIDKMASDAVASGSPANTIRPVTEDDVKEIYKELYI